MQANIIVRVVSELPESGNLSDITLQHPEELATSEIVERW